MRTAATLLLATVFLAGCPTRVVYDSDAGTGGGKVGGSGGGGGSAGIGGGGHTGTGGGSGEPGTLQGTGGGLGGIGDSGGAMMGGSGGAGGVKATGGVAGSSMPGSGGAAGQGGRGTGGIAGISGTGGKGGTGGVVQATGGAGPGGHGGSLSGGTGGTSGSGGAGVTHCSSEADCASGYACVSGTCTTCGANLTACSNVCADISSDGTNCGACGHSCLGGTCTNGTCLPITMASRQGTVSPVGLALNSSTVFTTTPGDGTSAWALYGFSKAAVNASPSPILTAAAGNGVTGFLGANDTALFVETGYASPGGSSSTMISCNPGNCESSQQNWYVSHGTVNVCDPSAEECFTATTSGTFATVQFSKQSTASQTSPQDFTPILNVADGALAAAGGYLYAAGPYGMNTSPTDSVVQRVSQSGAGGVSTLANFGPDYGLNAPLIVASTRVFVIAGSLTSNTTGLVSLSLPNGVGNSAPSFLTGTSMPTNAWLAAWGDDTAIFFANSSHQWVTCPASGCTGTPSVLADASTAQPYIVGDAQAIYWLNTTTDPKTGKTTGFSVMKLAR